MLSVLTGFGPSTAVLALGFAADLGNTYYQNAQKELLECKKRQAAALKDTDESLKRLSEPSEEEVRVKYVNEQGEGETFLSREERDGFNKFLFRLTLQDKKFNQRMCDAEQSVVDSFAGRHLVPYLPLVSEAALPLAGLVFLINGIASVAYRNFKR